MVYYHRSKTNTNARNLLMFHIITVRSYLLHVQDIMEQVKNNAYTLLVSCFFIPNRNLFKWLLGSLILSWSSLYSVLNRWEKRKINTSKTIPVGIT